ncbi:MAG: saccharopine dehydrogenase family protein [Nitrospinales bacterium]
MDLNHVCHLHRKWFSNLRIITQDPKYVEYRLTSSFYGFSQEILAKGGPIDENSYWYEFNGWLADIRVDGHLEGLDGNLRQSEKITFKYHWTLGLIFRFLKPIFLKQKRDILSADSNALERMYELDQKGFQRMEPERPRIVVYGGSGFFGRLVVQDLLDHSDAEIVIASRKAKIIKLKIEDPTRVKYFISDINNSNSIEKVIDGADVMVCCTGPYQGMSLNLLKACINKKVNYVDVADDREFLLNAYQLKDAINESGIRAFIGCSVIPGMSMLLSNYCNLINNPLEKVKICITPGTKHVRGPGSFACLLDTLGNQIEIIESGELKSVDGWSGRETIDFPKPIGNRYVYYVVDTPDYYLQPKILGASTVQFKIGAEFDYLNKSLAMMGQIKEFFGLKSLDFLIPLFRKIIAFAGIFGTTRGGVIVETQKKDDPASKYSLSISARSHGEIIPAILPSIAAIKLIKNQINETGIINLAHWLDQQELIHECRKRNILVSKKLREENWEKLS